MHFKILLSVIVLSSLTTIAQNINIKGYVKDSNSRPVPFANIILMNDDGTVIISGTTTNDDGFFSVENLSEAKYVLEVRFLGYETQKLSLDLSNSIMLDDIILKDNIDQLGEILIFNKMPTISRQVDRLVFNVENSSISNGNVMDLLKYTPGVIVNDNGISIKNSTPTIYMNDRRIHLSIQEVMQLLEGTTASYIKSIEVITNPPARYEAEGGAIINIKTSKNIVTGYNGSIFGSYKQGYQYPKYSFGTSHFFKTEKLNTYINYNGSPRKDYEYNEEYINFFDSGSTSNTIVSKWETGYKRSKEYFNHNFNGNIDYEIDDKNSLALSGNILISPRENTHANVDSYTEVFDGNDSLDSIFISSNRSVQEVFNTGISLDYLHKFNKPGNVLSANLHYTNYDYSNFQDVNTEYFRPINSVLRRLNRFQTFSSQLIELYTGQIDFSLPITSSSNFETGGKVSMINSESILDQYEFVDNDRHQDFENSDEFLYDETNYAVYASLDKNWKKWDLKLGLRAEYTDIKSNSISTGENNNNDYAKFFPSFHLLHRLNEKNEVYVNYNKRIYRPRYNQLNPFKFFLNDNAFISGDPKLNPQIDDQVILGYTFNKKYTFEAYYRFEDNPTIQMVLQDNENQLISYKNTNIDQSISYGLDFLTYTQIIKNWNIYVVSSVYHYENKFLALQSDNVEFVTETWNLYAEINNYFTFLKDNSLTADLNFRYISPMVYGPSESSESYGVDFNIRKLLWKNRASISLGVTDIFNTLNTNSTTRYLNQDTFYKSNRENRLFVFGFNYKIGNYRLKESKKSIELDERNRL